MTPLILGISIFLGAIIFGGLLRYFLEPRVMLSSVESLLTPAELHFFKTLDLVIDGRLAIVPKVRIADLIEVSSTNSRARMRIFRSISSKHIDFVLADPAKFHPIAAVELDDSSHQRRDRRQRDIFVDEVFDKAGLPLIRIRAARSYEKSEIAKALRMVLEN